MKEFIRFIKRQPVLFIYTTIITVLTYGGFWLNSGDILTDTETYITHPADTINVFLRVGRFGLVLTKKLFSTEVYSSSMTVLYMMAAMVLLCLVFDFCVHRLADEQYRNSLLPFFLVFNGLYISSPVLIHQFYFTYQAFEMVFAFLLSVISAYLIFGWAVRVSKKGLRTEALHLAGISVPELLRLPLALIFMTWSFGTYQALVPYYIAVNSIFFLVFYLYGHVPEDICWLGLCLRLVFMFLLGFLGYLVLSKAIIYVRFGTFRTYLTDSYMSWGNVPIAQCFSNILGDIKRLVLRELPVYSRLYVPVTLGTIVLGIYRGIRFNRRGILWLIAGLLIMTCSCFFMTFVLGNYQVLRANMTEPLTFAFSAALLCLLLRDLEAWSLVKRLRAGYLLRYGCLLVLAMGLLSQLDMTNRYVELIHQVAEADVRMAEDIYDSTVSMRDPENEGQTPMVFVGSWSPELQGNGVQPWDATGISFFTIDSTNVQGSARIARLINILGLETAEPNADQYAMALEAAENMPCWPAEGSSIYKDGVIVVKLSQ